MIFEILTDAMAHGELILVEGGFCNWHLCRNGQLTIREIMVLPERRGQGVGRGMLETLKQTPGATSIFAKCPVDLPSNGWYRAMGFENVGAETTPSGRELNLWRLPL
jgi:GNAT superfamily N-acetyltransferase